MAWKRFVRDRCHRASCGRFRSPLSLMIKRNLLLVLLVVGAVVGFAIGAIVNDPVNRIIDPEQKATVIMLIGFPGELLMNMLKMIILPIVVASLITAVSTLNPDVARRIVRRTLIFYVLGNAIISGSFRFDPCVNYSPWFKRPSRNTKKCPKCEISKLGLATWCDKVQYLEICN